LPTLNLIGNYNFSAQRIAGLSSGTIIDAHLASFTQDNWAGDGGANNPYPFQVVQTSGAIIIGGTINGQVDQLGDWRTVYGHGNSAGVRIEDAPNATIRDWRISNTWDALRVSWNSQNFLIEDCWVTNARDDAVENDRLQSGTIRDSLFDGVFGGISIDPSNSSPVDGHNQTVTLDGVLMRLQPSLYLGEMTHSAFIKTDSATNGTVTPHLRFINNVIAIEDVTHHSYRSLRDAWAHTVESSGNYYLNLSDTPLPADYPMPPAGWTVLQGQAARDYWESSRTAWVDRHSGVDVPFTGVRFTGDSTSETIIGNALGNIILAQGGNDNISGGAGSDSLYGGLGADVLNGGADFDFARYDYAATAIYARLDGVAGAYGEAVGDTFISIEGLIGSRFNDVFVGNNINGDYLSGLDGNDTLYGLGGTDSLDGGAGNDNLYGGAGNDNLYGGAGGDTLNGGTGFDLARYDNAATLIYARLDGVTGSYGEAVGDTFTSIEGLVGSYFGDYLIGNNTNGDYLYGLGGNDALYGLGGADRLDGGTGNDTLYGGTGADQFVFNSTLNAATNVDLITDFQAGIDDIVLSQSVFSGIGTSVNANEFQLGTGANDTGDRIIYDQASGQLYFDADGLGGTAQTLFATVTAGTALTINDFIMIA
jgi:Ca2+-binding RTX toxin-like protein